MTRLEGMVAAVLNERELVLNIGSNAGVSVGMRFRILYPGGIAIKDPVTQQPLGSVEWPKTAVQIVSVQEQMSVGRTFRTVTTPAIGTPRYNVLGGIFGETYIPAKTEVETLRSDGRFAWKELDPNDTFVRVGDPAVQIVSEDQEHDAEDKTDDAAD